MKHVRYLPFGAALLAVVLVLWSCGDISVLTTLKAAEAAANTPGTVAAPAFSPSAGTYSSDQSVTITDSTAGATIYYTTDGSAPTASSTTYTGAITVAGNGTTETINAIAIASGMTNSAVAAAAYVINYAQVSTPQFSPPAGTYPNAQTVTISSSTSGVSIRYTTDGSSPSETVGTFYTAPISVAASQTIKAIAYESGWADSTVAIAPYHIALYYLYAANCGIDSIAAYSINISTGALTGVTGTPFTSAGHQPVYIAVDPTGPYMYVSNFGSTNVSAYTIAPTSGVPTFISNYLAGTNSEGIVAIPGKFVYVVSTTTKNVWAYTIGSGGGLTATSTPSFSVGATTNPYGAAIDPTQSYLYVASENSAGGIYSFPIGTTGNLGSASSSTTGQNPIWVVTVNPAGTSFVYVMNHNSPGSISAYYIGSGGVFNTISGSPFTTGVGNLPDNAAVDPTGKYLYVANYTDGTVSAFTIGSGGGLTAIAGSPFSVGTNPYSVAIDPTGKYLYVSNYIAGTVTGYPINTGGALGTTVASVITGLAGPSPEGIVILSFAP